jgi:hypothetical protein
VRDSCAATGDVQERRRYQRNSSVEGGDLEEVVPRPATAIDSDCRDGQRRHSTRTDTTVDSHALPAGRGTSSRLTLNSDSSALPQKPTAYQYVACNDVKLISPLRPFPRGQAAGRWCRSFNVAN